MTQEMQVIYELLSIIIFTGFFTGIFLSGSVVRIVEFTYDFIIRRRRLRRFKRQMLIKYPPSS